MAVRRGRQAAGTGPTAFVLNVSTSGLGAIRSLGRAGVPVIGLDPDPQHIGFYSRYCDARTCPHPVREPDELVAFLLKQAEELDEPGILSPASDGFVLFISRHRDALKDHFRFILPSPEVVEACVSKRTLYDLVDRAGLSHADTYYPTDMADINHIKHELQYPAYIKPYYSHLWQLAFPGTGKGIKVFSAAELVSSFERIFSTENQVMVQSIIAGPGSNVHSVRVYINGNGEVLGAFTNRKIRQFPVEFGRAVLAESIDDPELREMGLNFFRQIEYRGIGELEFKRDDRDGVLKVTDLNTRWIKTVTLPTAAGIDFPLLHYLDLAGRNPAPQMEFTAGIRWLDLIGDLAASWTLYRGGELTPQEWVRSWGGVRSFAFFALDDLKPFFREYDNGRRLLRVPVNLLRRR